MEYRIDLFAIFILLGLVQALFLSFFFLRKEPRKLRANRFQAYFLLSIAGVVLEILLMYTGYIVDAIHLVDFSEPLAFLIGPLIFFIVISSFDNNALNKLWPHYIAPLFWLLYNLQLHIQPEAVKYNAYLDAYHPDWDRLPETMMISDDPFKIRSLHSELVMLSILIYTVLAFYKYYRHVKNNGLRFWHADGLLVARSRNYLIISMAMLLVILVSKSLYQHDLGDHFIASMMAILIYFTSFDLIRSSTLLATVPGGRRYERSSLTPERQADTSSKVKRVLEEGVEHLRVGFSLSDLASLVGVSTHHLSETINEGFNKSFSELLADYRIKAACELLGSEKGQMLKMEEIAEMVGYSSKSTFNVQFKKVMNETPSAYRQRMGEK